jgi:hypothetical protein
LLEVGSRFFRAQIGLFEFEATQIRVQPDHRSTVRAHRTVIFDQKVFGLRAWRFRLNVGALLLLHVQFAQNPGLPRSVDAEDESAVTLLGVDGDQRTGVLMQTWKGLWHVEIHAYNRWTARRRRCASAITFM